MPLLQVTGMRLELLGPDLLDTWNALLATSLSLLHLSLKVSEAFGCLARLSTRITAFPV